MDIKTAAEVSDAKETMRLLLRNQSADQSRNEAQTRFDIIDVLIQGALGWDRSHFVLEKADGQEYTDYELGHPLQVIWEAKREGKTFSVPIRVKRGMVHDLASVMIMSSDTRDAVMQVNSYGLRRGAEIAVASNGHQLIAFCPRNATTTTIPGKCIVVPSLAEFEKNIDRLWQFLSPEGVALGTLRSFLERMAAPTAPKKLSSLIPNYPQFLHASDLQQSLASMAHLLLINVEMQSDIEQQFFEECYCESGALSQHALLSRQMLTARYASLFPPEDRAPRIEPVVAKPGKPLLTPEILADAISNRPIVLLGDVGVGKSSFLKHLMYVSAYDEFQRALYVYVDLGKTGALSNDLKDVVLDQVEDALLNEYNVDLYESEFVKSVYKQDVRRFDRGIYGADKDNDPTTYRHHLNSMLSLKQNDRANHTKSAIAYLAKEKRRQIIIALDNSDQRDTDTQQEAFLIAQTMASDWRATVFISMRPRTFYQSRRSGTLSAYPHRVFTISPPRVDLMMKKRLQFAIDVALGRRNLETLSQISLNLSNIAAFLEVVLNTIERNDDVKLFIENITGGNIRSLVELVANTIGSPNTDTEGVVRALERDGNYELPVHDWWKVAIKGDFKFYDPTKSITANIFTVFGTDKKEHFLVSMILAYLDTSGKHRNAEGFVTYSELSREMQVWGFRASSIEAAVRFANNMRLIESNRRLTFDEDEAGLYGTLPELWRINTIGVYHLRVWSTTFPYIDAMTIDTPLFDEELFETLAHDIRSTSLRDRFERAKSIKDYLSEIWDGSSISTSFYDWSNLCAAGASTFTRVERYLIRAQSS